MFHSTNTLTIRAFFFLCAALLVGCAESDPEPTSALPLSTVLIEAHGEVVAPGDALHIDANYYPDELDVSIVSGGEEHALTPLDTVTSFAGALYPIPEAIEVGAAQIFIHYKYEEEQPSVIDIEVTRPWFDSIPFESTHAPFEDSDLHSMAGVAVGDVDGDGAQDFFFGNASSPARLFFSTIDDADALEFIDQTALIGDITDASAAVFIDFDNDGDQDLYVGRAGADLFFINQHAETGRVYFEERAAALGVGQTPFMTAGSAWGDYDGDGDLDLYVAHYERRGEAGDGADHFYRNDGDHFTDVTTMLPGAHNFYSMTPLWLDYDRDGDVDLIVISDHLNLDRARPNMLWRNDGLGVEEEWIFTDAAEESGLAIIPDGKGRRLNGMGVAVADFDDNGYPDLVITNIGPNLLLSNHDGVFTDVAAEANAERRYLAWGGDEETAALAWSVAWGAHAADFDNDTDADILLIGGSQPEWFGARHSTHALLEQTGAMQFQDRSPSAGLMDPRVGLASATVDVDQNGWLDVVVVNASSHATLYQNRRGDLEPFSSHRWVGARLEGSLSNRDAIGAVVELIQGDGRTQRCFLTTRPSYGAGGERTCHFGLGLEATAEALRVLWPSGQTSTTNVSEMNRYFLIKEPTP